LVPREAWGPSPHSDGTLSEADILISGTVAWRRTGLAAHAVELDGLGGDDFVLSHDWKASRSTG
jgi:hypothetical protein